MSLFFDDVDEIPKRGRKAPSKTMPLEMARLHGCDVCPLKTSKAKHPDLKPKGSETPLLYFLADQPELEDDASGDVFSGTLAKALLDATVHEEDEEFLRFNTLVRTRPPSGREPTEFEVECCRLSIEQDIEKSKPVVVVALGTSVFNWFKITGNFDKCAKTVNAWRGRLIPYTIGKHSFWIMVTFDSKFVESKQRYIASGKNKGKPLPNEFKNIQIKDVEKAFEFAESVYYSSTSTESIPPPTPLDDKDILKGIEYTTGNRSDKEITKIQGWLNSLLKEPYIGIDIETDGFRPFRHTSYLYTVAVGTKEKTYSFPLEWDKCWTASQEKKVKKIFFNFLKNYKGVKIAHNLKFEQEWLADRYGTDILTETLWDDTMAQAYTLDERRGMLSLDVLVFLHFGFYLKKFSDVDRSRIGDYPPERIVKYNALDTKWTHALYLKLEKELLQHKELISVHDHLIEETITLSKIQLRGLDVDWKKHAQWKRKLTTISESVEQDIQAMEDVRAFVKKTRKPFQTTSPEQVGDFLDFLGIDHTKNGKKSTDESVLESIEHPIAEKILELRGALKKLSTYIEPLTDLADNKTGRIHTNFNPYYTTSGRLSSDNPNMQNWPSRKGKEIRELIAAWLKHNGYDDWWMICADYGQIEARILGCASQDATFCEALWNDYDIHMEWAVRIAEQYPAVVGGEEFLKDQQALKKFRGYVKNQWVFPAFYGSSPNSISKAMGIPKEIVFGLFEDFWKDFSDIKKWQKWVVNFYERHGYVESMTGRRRHGPLGYNEIINMPIQSSASDICTNAMSRLDREGIEVVLNIHDDVTSMVRDDRLEEEIDMIAEIMCDVPYPWINVPITVELSAGKDWFHQEEIDVFKSTDFKKVSKSPMAIGEYRKIMGWETHA